MGRFELFALFLAAIAGCPIGKHSSEESSSEHPLDGRKAAQGDRA